MIPLRTRASRQGLEDFCRYIVDYYGSKLTLLEVGSWAGSSAVIFAKYFELVTCVDPWAPTEGTISESYDMRDVEQLFDHNVQYMNNIIKVKSRIQDAIKNLGSYDIVYIDGEHTYDAVKRDINLCEPHCNKIMAGHDYWPGRFDGVIKAVNEKYKKPDITFKDTTWSKRIK